jgi:Na+-transporting methylmalonyl-CoA/oxaloacetate decarboxylase gamma subunit
MVKKVGLMIGFLISGFIAFAQEPDVAQTNQSGGYGIFFTTILVVFLALFLLFLFIKLIGKYINIRQKKNNENMATLDGKPVVHEEISGEVFAAISTALYLYETEQHDFESTILTINRAAKNYSPWSSKIYGLRQTPQKETRKG